PGSLLHELVYAPRKCSLVDAGPGGPPGWCPPHRADTLGRRARDQTARNSDLGDYPRASAGDHRVIPAGRGRPPPPVRGGASLDPLTGDQLSPWDRRLESLPARPQRLTLPDRHRRHRLGDPAAEGVHPPAPDSGDRDRGDSAGARPHPLLRLLGGDAGSALLPDRSLG